MATIYVDQELTLNFTDSDGKDMGSIDFRVDYWNPGNTTDTPDGTIAAGNISTVIGSSVVLITITTGILSIPTSQGKMWRFQLIDNVTGVGWTPMSVDVKNKGTQVNNSQ